MWSGIDDSQRSMRKNGKKKEKEKGKLVE